MTSGAQGIGFIAGGFDIRVRMSFSLPTEDSLIGTLVVGRYHVIRVLGEGGMGRVYLAEHAAIKKAVALKVLRDEFTNRGDIVSRFQQEAISASRIKHPNVLEIFDFGKLDSGSFFLAMELLEGRDLAQELRRLRTIDFMTGMRIALQICSGLAAAHARGVVHRDMKPDNVFLQQGSNGDLSVKIVDFGIAQLRDEGAVIDSERRITKAGTILGTPEYMAPEQGAGQPADHRSDIYALGVILYEMFTGRVPFSGPTFVEVLAKHQSEAPPPIHAPLSPELKTIILRALAKKPEDRFQRISDLQRALAATTEGAMAARQAARSGSLTPVPRTPRKDSGRPSSPPGGGTDGGSRLPSRVETPIATEASVVRPPPIASKRLAIGGLAATIALGVALALAVAVSPGRRPRAAASVPSAPAPTLGIGASVAAVVTEHAIEIVTQPSGALVRKNGHAACAVTPCRIRARHGETVELEATSGRLRGGAKIVAQRDQTVKIELTETGVRLCNVEVDGVWHGPCDP
ncbi:MAG TPA: serine/threonine-protein kinase [Polyangiaceae bacterium]